MDEFPVVRRIHRAARDVVAAVEHLAGASGLTAAEVDVLGVLAGRAPCPVGEVAAEAGYKASTLTSVLDRLVARGYVARALSPVDRRSFVVSLTPMGGRAVRALAHQLAGLERVVSRSVPRAQIDAWLALSARLGAAAASGRSGS
jgi:DNA-binding MarR family transcriptional regulator